MNFVARESNECSLDDRHCDFTETKRLSALMRDDADPSNDKWAVVAQAYVDDASGIHYMAAEQLRP